MTPHSSTAAATETTNTAAPAVASLDPSLSTVSQPQNNDEDDDGVTVVAPTVMPARYKSTNDNESKQLHADITIVGATGPRWTFLMCS